MAQRGIAHRSAIFNVLVCTAHRGTRRAACPAAAGVAVLPVPTAVPAALWQPWGGPPPAFTSRTCPPRCAWLASFGLLRLFRKLPLKTIRSSRFVSFCLKPCSRQSLLFDDRWVTASFVNDWISNAGLTVIMDLDSEPITYSTVAVLLPLSHHTGCSLLQGIRTPGPAEGHGTRARCCSGARPGLGEYKLLGPFF